MSINPKSSYNFTTVHDNDDELDLDEIAQTDNSYEPSAPPSEDLDREGSSKNTSVIAGAAAVGGVVGLFVLGPFGAILAAGGAAFAATQKGAGGDVARSAGNLGISAGKKAKELDEKHKILDKTKAATSKAFEKSKEYEAKHNIIAKTKTAASSTAKGLSKFDKEHGVSEKVGKGVVQGVDYLNKQISKDGKDGKGESKDGRK